MNIIYIHCPVCKDKWIREDTDVVCKDCEEQVALDIELDEIIKLVDKFHCFQPPTLSQRKAVLERIIGKVNFHIGRIKNFEKSLNKKGK